MNGPIVVTGAAGFIGRNVVAALNARGRRDIFLVDLLGSDERWKNLQGLEFEEIWSRSSCSAPSTATGCRALRR